MSFDEFVAYWTGKPVDFDGIYPNQCMDMMHQYVYDVLNITDKTALAQPSAYLVYDAFDSEKGRQYFEKVINTPSNVPQKGDIVVFGQQVGTNGHICIFISGDVNNFLSFDANWPAMTLPHQQEHTYAGVLGWLHPIASTIPLSVQEVQSQLNNQVTATTECQTQLQTANTQISDLQEKLVALQKKYDALSLKDDANEQEIVTLNGALQTLTGTNKDYATESYNAQSRTRDLESYLDATAERLGIKTKDLGDKDIEEKILANVDSLNKILHAKDMQIERLSQSPKQQLLSTVKSPGFWESLHSFFFT